MTGISLNCTFISQKNSNPNPIIAQPNAVPIETAGLVSLLLASKSLQKKGDLAAVRTADVCARRE